MSNLAGQGTKSGEGTMLQEEELREQTPQDLRDQIRAFGWKESADFVACGIEFVADLYGAGKLAPLEIRNYGHDTRIALKILAELRAGPCEEEVRRLNDAVISFNHSLKSRHSRHLPIDGGDPWTLSNAMRWREDLDYACQACESCCESWRMVHLDRLSPEHRGPALRCIEEIETRIPLLRSGRLADVPKQREAMDKCVILSGQLAGYANDIDTVELYAEAIVHNPKKWAALL